MRDLRELYQQVILDHNRAPRNYRRLDGANHHAEGNNPLCGDRISVFVDVRDGVIEDIGFQGSGCAISKASTSLMTAAVKGKSVDEAQELFEGFHGMVTGVATPDRAKLGKLVALGGVRAFPARVKCASLAWHTLRAALKNRVDAVTTE